MVSKLNTASLGILAVLAMGVVLRAPEAAAAGPGQAEYGQREAGYPALQDGKLRRGRAKIFLQLSIDNPSMPVFVRNLGRLLLLSAPSRPGHVQPARVPAQEKGHRA